MREKLIPIAKVASAIRRIERRGSDEERKAMSAALRLLSQARTREAIMEIDAKLKYRSMARGRSLD